MYNIDPLARDEKAAQFGRRNKRILISRELQPIVLSSFFGEGGEEEFCTVFYLVLYRGGRDRAKNLQWHKSLSDKT